MQAFEHPAHALDHPKWSVDERLIEAVTSAGHQVQSIHKNVHRGLRSFGRRLEGGRFPELAERVPIDHRRWVLHRRRRCRGRVADRDQDIGPHVAGKPQHLLQRDVVGASHEARRQTQSDGDKGDVFRCRARVDERQHVASLHTHRGLGPLQVGADDDDSGRVREKAWRHLPHRPHHAGMCHYDDAPYELVAAHRGAARGPHQSRQRLLVHGLGSEGAVEPAFAYRLKDFHCRLLSSIARWE